MSRAGNDRPRVWRELLFAGVFYGLYTVVRDLQGSAAVSYDRALRNAQQVIDLERKVGLFHEQGIQQAVLGAHWLISIANILYGSLHFVITIAALTVLFRRDAQIYRWARNALAATTGIALIGFTLFPMAPPRLLPTSYGFVDTLARYGTLWSFASGPVSKLSNQYAAMPSLHFAWAMWCTIGLLAVLKNRWARMLIVAYPVITLSVIIVTANHFFLDAVFGAITVAAGFGVSELIARAQTRPAPSSAQAPSTAHRRVVTPGCDVLNGLRPANQ